MFDLNKRTDDFDNLAFEIYHRNSNHLLDPLRYLQGQCAWHIDQDIPGLGAGYQRLSLAEARAKLKAADIDECAPFFVPTTSPAQPPQVNGDIPDLSQRLGDIRAGVLVADVAEYLHRLVPLIDEVDIGERTEMPCMHQLVTERCDCGFE